jgi:hypothetical protein
MCGRTTSAAQGERHHTLFSLSGSLVFAMQLLMRQQQPKRVSARLSTPRWPEFCDVDGCVGRECTLNCRSSWEVRLLVIRAFCKRNASITRLKLCLGRLEQWVSFRLRELALLDLLSSLFYLFELSTAVYINIVQGGFRDRTARRREQPYPFLIRPSIQI